MKLGRLGPPHEPGEIPDGNVQVGDAGAVQDAVELAIGIVRPSMLLQTAAPPAPETAMTMPSGEGQDGRMSNDYPTVPAPWLPRLDPEMAVDRCREFAKTMATRRTVRDFSTDPIPLEAVREAVRAAATAPSGANLQPWRFVLVTDPERKRLLRQGAEEEERAFYASRASEEWREALAPLGTDWRKPFLEDAPVIIAVMEVHRSEESPRPYYAKESVGIAVGLLLAALHGAGFATLTHTPSPMKWISRVLERPTHERPFALIPVGYPAKTARVPDISRKPLADVLTEIGP